MEIERPKNTGSDATVGRSILDEGWHEAEEKEKHRAGEGPRGKRQRADGVAVAHEKKYRRFEFASDDLGGQTLHSILTKRGGRRTQSPTTRKTSA